MKKPRNHLPHEVLQARAHLTLLALTYAEAAARLARLGKPRHPGHIGQVLSGHRRSLALVSDILQLSA